ncbi:multidrug ABC transporter substrate-binding protein [Capsulimonas corticalis]|uniref:Multidrug ABC transporter substrate-binding protein n=1 Tax=Capsulimonas corticalis TaxID=2219043 RepID=A0A402D5J2_9BACT|nr:ABC transporter permease [Capsulimonas corticalis]BDI29767.1 multidrug ABC transporter substrate-binding protein [Capsulimonas corticalis]
MAVEEIPSPAAANMAGESKITFGDKGLVNLTMALRGLGANKLRAFLTMLGVIIGVGAVIIAIAIGQGSRAAVAASLQKLGTNVLTVFPGQQRSGGVSQGLGSTNTMVLADADAILKDCPSVARVSPQVNKNAQVKYKANNTNTSIYGTGVDYPIISNHPIADGRYITKADIHSNARVAVLGSTASTNLFDTQNPVGRTVQIAGQSFKVVGLLQSKGGQGFRNPDDGVYVPISTAMRRLFGLKNIQTITCQARTETLMTQAQTEIDTVMRRQHKIASDGNPDFIIFNQADLAQAQNAQQDTFSSLITYLAVVSLVVGGIGIMNIMLVSVTERTREIGVRKAIGAKRKDILTQFLLEALLLSLVGGLLGVAMGIGGAQLVQIKNGWTIVIQPQTVLLAFSFSAVVGVFFGFYPAFKASQMNPIEALRYE